jgi:RNA polymerase subunit RPABC4/transcription elongation factor Spt4
MSNLIETVFCLSCRNPMPARDSVCPQCGADQAEIRAVRPTPNARIAPKGKSAPVARTETVACPKCFTPVEPNRTMCPYCGRVIDDPGAQARFQAGNAPVYVGIGAVFIALAFVLMLTPWYWMLGLCAVVFGHLAQAEDRQNGAAPRVIFGGWAIILFDFAVRWAITFFMLTRFVQIMNGK